MAEPRPIDEILDDMVKGLSLSPRDATAYAEHCVEQERARLFRSPEWLSENEFSAGHCKITVDDPYPIWCRISYGGKEVMSLHHAELADLKHVLDRAMACARRKLGTKADEV